MPRIRPQRGGSKISRKGNVFELSRVEIKFVQYHTTLTVGWFKEKLAERHGIVVIFISQKCKQPTRRLKLPRRVDLAKIIQAFTQCYATLRSYENGIKHSLLRFS